MPAVTSSASIASLPSSAIATDVCARSLLLTRLPRGRDTRQQRSFLRELFSQRWFSAHPAAISVPENRQAVYTYLERSAAANTALRRALAGSRLGWGTCWGSGVHRARRRAAVMSARLEHARQLAQTSPKSTEMAFVVFRDVATCQRVRLSLEKLASRRRYGHGEPGGGAPPAPPAHIEAALRPLHWRVRQAPPPDGIRWRNVGRTRLSKLSRRIVANGAVLFVLVVSFSPQVLILSLGSVRISGGETASDGLTGLWRVLVSWANAQGALAGFILHFIPNLIVLLVLYLLIPWLLRRASRFEWHAIRTHEERVLVSRMFFFFVINLVLLTAVNRAAVYGYLHNVSSCFFPSGGGGGGGGGGGEEPLEPSCESFENMLGDSFIPDSTLVLTAFLLTAAFVGVPLDALSWWSWPVELVRRTRRKHQSAAAMPLLEVEGDDGDADTSAVDSTDASPFDFAASFAYSSCIFCMAMWSAVLCPLALVPGVAYFAMRFVVDRYNFLTVYAHETSDDAAASTDGRLAERGLNMLRVSVILQCVGLLVFLGLRGTHAQRLAAALLAIGIGCAALRDAKAGADDDVGGRGRRDDDEEELLMEDVGELAPGMFDDMDDAVVPGLHSDDGSDDAFDPYSAPSDAAVCGVSDESASSSSSGIGRGSAGLLPRAGAGVVSGAGL